MARAKYKYIQTQMDLIRRFRSAKPGELFSEYELSQILGISITAMINARCNERGINPHFDVNGSPVYEKSKIDKWIANNPNFINDKKYREN